MRASVFGPRKMLPYWKLQGIFKDLMKYNILLLLMKTLILEAASDILPGDSSHAYRAESRRSSGVGKAVLICSTRRGKGRRKDPDVDNSLALQATDCD